MGRVGEDADGDQELQMPMWMKRQLRSNADEISEPESIEECSDEEAFGGGAPLYLHEECSDEEASGGDEPSLMHA